MIEHGFVSPGRGFALAFANGAHVSVQWGSDHCCDARDKNTHKSADAEVHMWIYGGLQRAIGDDARVFGSPGGIDGYQTPEQVVETLARVAAYTREELVEQADNYEREEDE